MKEGKIHIVKREGKWILKKEGRVRALSVHETKNKALFAAKRLKYKGYTIIVNGKISNVKIKPKKTEIYFISNKHSKELTKIDILKLSPLLNKLKYN